MLLHAITCGTHDGHAVTEDITAQRSTDVSALELDAAPPNGVLATAHEDTIASVVTGELATHHHCLVASKCVQLQGA